jgi:TolB-like protein/Tfp pilus assembly protein PilF
MASGAFESAKMIRDHVARILANPDFANFPRSGAFLTYLVDQTLEGRGGDLKEAVIGVEVFGREPGYDSKSDSVVRTQARRVREKLNEYYSTAGQADPIRIAIPKGGYIPEFQTVAKLAEAIPRPRNRIAAIAGALAVLAAAGAVASLARRPVPHDVRLPAIAVLPVADLDPARRFDSLADGLTEDLERGFSRIHDLRVHARPPATLTPAERSDYASLSKRLAVDALLDGQIVTESDHSEIRLSLIRAADSSLLWTDHFPVDTAIGSIERQIETSVARALNVKPPAVTTHAENPRAHDLFFAGRTLWATRNPEKTKQAIQLYQQALAIDPDDALAYMGIADAYALMAAHGQIDSQIALDRGEPAVRKALELDPALAEAHAALGMLQCLQWKFKACDAEYQRAIELNPSYDRAYARARVVRFLFGDFPAAERLIRESERLNPYAMSLPLIRAELYYYWRRYNDSEDLIHEVLKADPKNTTAFQLLARDYLEQHQPQRAVEAERSAVAAEPDALLLQAELASFLHQAGNSAEAAQRLAHVLHAGQSAPVDPYALAIMYARMGDKAKTLDSLEAALAARTGDLPSLRWDPALDFVRKEPRFENIVRRIYEQN